MQRLLFVLLITLFVFPHVSFAETIIDPPQFSITKEELGRWLHVLKPFLYLAFWSALFWFALIGGTRIKVLTCFVGVAGIAFLLI